MWNLVSQRQTHWIQLLDFWTSAKSENKEYRLSSNNIPEQYSHSEKLDICLESTE